LGHCLGLQHSFSRMTFPSVFWIARFVPVKVSNAEQTP